MIKSGDYVMIAEHNYAELKRFARTRIWQDDIQGGSIGSIYRVIITPLETSEYTYVLDFATESLEDFIRTQPDIDPDRIQIGLSWFDFKARKLERELKQQIIDYKNQIKQKDVESTTEYKLNSLMTEFSEPLFTKLATEAKSIEMLASQVTTIKKHCSFYSQKYTVAYDVIDNYNERKQELTELLEIFTEKRKELELELLNNKADQALEKV